MTNQIHIGEQMIDITAGLETVVEISIRDDGRVIWVNVDGVCRLRCCRIEKLVVDDRRVPSFEISVPEEE